MDDKRPMNGKEMAVVEYLAALDSQLCKSDVLRERLKAIPNGWRQMRLIVTATDKLLRQLYDTMTRKNLLHISSICDYGEVLIRFRPAAQTTERKLVNESDLRVLLRVCISQECSICLREGKDAKRCALREAMMNIAPLLDDEETTFGCGYQRIAMENLDEELGG